MDALLGEHKKRGLRLIRVALFHLFGALAQFERALIQERTEVRPRFVMVWTPVRGDLHNMR